MRRSHARAILMLAIVSLLGWAQPCHAKGEEQKLVRLRQELAKTRAALDARVGRDRRWELEQLKSDQDTYAAWVKRLRDRAFIALDKRVKLRDIEHALNVARSHLAQARNYDVRAQAQKAVDDATRRLAEHKQSSVDPLVARREELVAEGIKTFDQFEARANGIKAELDALGRSDRETRRLLDYVVKLTGDIRYLEDVLKRGPEFRLIEVMRVPEGDYTRTRTEGSLKGSWQRISVSSYGFKETQHYIRNGKFESEWAFDFSWGSLPSTVQGGHQFEVDVTAKLEIRTHLEDHQVIGALSLFDTRTEGAHMTTTRPNGMKLSALSKKDECHYTFRPSLGGRRFLVRFLGKLRSVTFVYER